MSKTTTNGQKGTPTVRADDLQIVGLQEISILLKVDTRTPHAWQYRKLLPDPDYPAVNGGRAWKRRTIISWAAETGRLGQNSPLKKELPKSAKIGPRRGGRRAKQEA